MRELFQTDDGQQFISKEAAREHECKLKGLIYKCPVCSGSGKKVSYYEKIDLGWPAGEVDEPVYGSCNTCLGVGYSKTKFVPITEVRVVGYKRALDSEEG